MRAALTPIALISFFSLPGFADLPQAYDSYLLKDLPPITISVNTYLTFQAGQAVIRFSKGQPTREKLPLSEYCSVIRAERWIQPDGTPLYIPKAGYDSPPGEIVSPGVFQFEKFYNFGWAEYPEWYRKMYLGWHPEEKGHENTGTLILARGTPELSIELDCRGKGDAWPTYARLKAAFQDKITLSLATGSLTSQPASNATYVANKVLTASDGTQWTLGADGLYHAQANGYDGTWAPGYPPSWVPTK